MNDGVFHERRLILRAGGALLLTSMVRPQRSQADDPVLIDLSGTPNGSHVWFQPRGLLIERGQTVKWLNTDVGNVHTTTAYHPSNQGKPLRIPADATGWNSGYLLPGESYSHTFDEPGVYDYFCMPHEPAGMVGRIIVQAPEQGAQNARLTSDKLLPPEAVAQFVSIQQIMKEGRVA